LQNLNLKPDEKSPDLILVNSCIVTESAFRKTRKKCQSLRRKFGDTHLIVFGCAAKIYHEKCKEIADYICRDYLEVGDLLSELEIDSRQSLSKRTLTAAPAAESLAGDSARELIPNSQFPNFPEGRTRKLIKIQSGCDNFCSFCLVCLARGRSQSRSRKEILDEILRAEDIGFKEIVITGTNIAAFACQKTTDFKSSKFSDLIFEILEKTKIPRIRFSSLYLQYLDKDFFELIKNKRICDHFHLSLQHTENLILKKMNRPYSQEDIRDICQKIREIRPNSCLAADIIVGFPYETEEIFRNLTIELETLPLNRIHVFPFSPREGTKASEFPLINEKVIKKRAATLQKIARKKWDDFLQINSDKTHEVLFETESFGHSTNYFPVTVKGGNFRNEIMKVKGLSCCLGKLKKNEKSVI